MFSKASSIIFLFNNPITDLNSDQLVSVDKTKNHIIHLGANEASAVKFTIGSKKNQLIINIVIQNGKYNLFTFSILLTIFFSLNFLFNKYTLIKNEIKTQ